MYLIDTDTLVYFLNGKPEVVQAIIEAAGKPRAMSVVTYGELIYGAQNSKRRIENLAKVRLLAQQFPVIDVDKTVMETFGQLKVTLVKTGAVVDDFDLVIASTAIAIGYTLVTNNTRHFQKIPGLLLENWARR